MRSPSEHIKLLQRRVDFLKSREHQNSYDLAEIGSLEWALTNLPTKQERLCRDDGRCQYAIDSGAEGMGHCPEGKCVMPAKQEQDEPVAKVKRNLSGQIYIEWRDGEFAIANLVEAKLYTTPQQRKPLTNENPLLVFAKECVLGAYSETELADAAFRAIEAAHGIKGEV